jgi:LL-diaminopimelate aminotransferase
MIETSERLGRLPSYKMNELAASKKRLLAEGREVIDLSAGDADFPPPDLAVEVLYEALADPAMSRYPFQVGLVEFREAVARYMERRFGVVVNPMDEVLPLIGCKDGLAHLPLAILSPGDVCVIPEPAYPGYMGAFLSDGEIERYALQPDKGYLVELEELGADTLSRTKLVFVNYPNNPTTAVAPMDYLERTVDTCRRNGIVLAYDNPYCELTFDGYRAPSILQVEGAREIALEFHSFSKSFSMTGWRLGWAVGSADLIAALSKVKSYMDTGVFLAIQRAGAALLDCADELIQPIVSSLSTRRDAAVAAFRGAGFAFEPPRATMYLWIPLPGGVTSAAFAAEILERHGVVVMPGSAFGAAGEGYFRIALTVEPERLEHAAQLIGSVLSESHETGLRA